MHRILALIIKEFLAVWRDKKSRIILISPPLIQLFIFAFAATLDVTNVSIGVLNRDHGEKGFQLVEHLRGSPIFKHIIPLGTVGEITPFIDNQKGVLVVSIDEQFSRNLDSNKVGNLQLILDGRKSNTAQIVVGYVMTVIQQFYEEVSKKRFSPPLAELVPRNWFNSNLNYIWFNIPGLLVILTTLEALLIVGLSVARERELGTFDQLLVSPLVSKEILIGKTVPGIIISLGEGTLLLLAGVFFFKVPFTGSLLLLYLSMFVFICSIIGVGLFLSSLCSTQQQAILGSFIFLTPGILLSGFATPIENMPTWLQYVTYVNPLRYFIVICRGLFLKAMDVKMVLNLIWPMIIIAAFTLSSATYLFRRRLE